MPRDSKDFKSTVGCQKVKALTTPWWKPKASFTRSGCRPAGRIRLQPDKVVEHRKVYAYSHNPVIWPAGCRVAPGSIHCNVRSPAGS